MWTLRALNFSKISVSCFLLIKLNQFGGCLILLPIFFFNNPQNFFAMSHPPSTHISFHIFALLLLLIISSFSKHNFVINRKMIISSYVFQSKFFHPCVCLSSFFAHVFFLMEFLRISFRFPKIFPVFPLVPHIFLSFPDTQDKFRFSHKQTFAEVKWCFINLIGSEDKRCWKLS